MSSGMKTGRAGRAARAGTIFDPGVHPPCGDPGDALGRLRATNSRRANSRGPAREMRRAGGSLRARAMVRRAGARGRRAGEFGRIRANSAERAKPRPRRWGMSA